MSERRPAYCVHSALCAGLTPDIKNIKMENKNEKKPYDRPVEESEYDRINHPSHYTEGRQYEPIDVINDWELGFNLGNAVKYISRAGRKGNKVEDLRKAIFYIGYEIKHTLGEEVDNGGL